MAKFAVFLILILVAAATTTTTHGGRALKVERSTSRILEVAPAEPPSSTADDIAALRSLFPTVVKTADGPVAFYYPRPELNYKVPVTGF
jgi:hypothetical protein